MYDHIWEFVVRVQAFTLNTYMTLYYAPEKKNGEPLDADGIAVGMQLRVNAFGFWAGDETDGWDIYKRRKITAAGPQAWEDVGIPLTLKKNVGQPSMHPLLAERVGRRGDGDAVNFQGSIYWAGRSVFGGHHGVEGKYGDDTGWQDALWHGLLWCPNNLGPLSREPKCVVYSAKLNQWQELTAVRRYALLGTQRRRRLPRHVGGLWPT